MTLPRMSIVTPSYNQAAFLEETILSVFAQDYPDLEYLVLDGGSDDGSIDIIKSHEERISFWVSEPDRGQSHAINKGFRMATGEILGWLNSDDTYLPGCLRAVGEFFAANTEVKVAYGNFVYVDEEGRTLRQRHLPRRLSYTKLLFHDYLGQPAVFFRKEVLDRVGYLDECLRYSMDWDLFLRMRWQYDMAHINRNLATYRLHTKSKTSKEGDATYSEHLRAIFRKNKKPRFSNRALDELYYRLYRTYSYLQRTAAVVRDNPMDYLRVYRTSSSLRVGDLWRFISWRLRHG